MIVRGEDVLERMPEVPLGAGLEALALRSPVAWCNVNRRIHGLPLIYDNLPNVDKILAEDPVEMRRHRPFLEEPLSSPHRHKAVIKGRQVGVSELFLSEAVHFLATHKRKKWVITFPREGQLLNFSATRIVPTFQETERMRRLLQGANAGRISIAESFLILKSSWESAIGEGVDADGLTLDELDRMKPGVAAAFTESLESSPTGRQRDLSTPTVPNKGIHALYERSDQRTWLVRCTRCTLEQDVAYPDNVVQVRDLPANAKEIPEGTYEYLCRKEKCRGKLDRLRGRWVAKFPDRQRIRGYHISQLIASWHSASHLMQKKREIPYLQTWLNYICGMPAIGDNVLLSESHVDAACSGHQLLQARTDDWQNVCAGVDWGDQSWVVVGAQNRHNERWYVIGVKWFDDDKQDPLGAAKNVARYLDDFQPDVVVADAGYGRDRNKYLFKKYGPGRFWACQYNPSTRGSSKLQPTWSSDDQAKVMVDRTSSLKGTCLAVRELELGLPDLTTEAGSTLAAHLLALTPLYLEDPDGEGEGTLVETVDASGPDHLAHSVCYMLLGAERVAKLGRFDCVWI